MIEDDHEHGGGTEEDGEGVELGVGNHVDFWGGRIEGSWSGVVVFVVVLESTRLGELWVDLGGKAAVNTGAARVVKKAWGQDVESGVEQCERTLRGKYS